MQQKCMTMPSPGPFHRLLFFTHRLHGCSLGRGASRRPPPACPIFHLSQHVDDQTPPTNRSSPSHALSHIINSLSNTITVLIFTPSMASILFPIVATPLVSNPRSRSSPLLGGSRHHGSHERRHLLPCPGGSNQRRAITEIAPPPRLPKSSSS